MINRLKVSNFKSLLEFELRDMRNFVCLIGLNGSGKTTVLQFLDFMHSTLTGNVRVWLDMHKWRAHDLLNFEYKRKNVIEFEVDITTKNNVQYQWKARFNTQELRCTWENLYRNNEPYISYSDKQLKIYGDSSAKLPANFSFEGSALQFFKEDDFYKELFGVKKFGILNSNVISQASQTRSDVRDVDVGDDGHGLIGFISALNKEDQEDLYKRIHQFYPPIREFNIKKQRFGWKSLLLSELERTYFDSSHLSDGTLRLFVILSQLYSKNRTILFDEIENGFNQEIIQKLLDVILNFNGKQVIVTTHSALVLNYLDDETAKSSVYILYKKGTSTLARKFFESELGKNLEYTNPGEIMSNLNLVEYTKQLISEE